MKIVLLGYMASGKSAIGKQFAEIQNMKFIDLDSYIEENEGLEISEIFDKKGEIYFRRVEGKYLEELLNKNGDFVISLGGGTPCYGSNMNLIEEKSHSVYLKASIKTIFNRLKNETSQRPLVANIGLENLQEYIAKHLFERRDFYERAANTVSVDDKSIEEITKEVVTLF